MYLFTKLTNEHLPLYPPVCFIVCLVAKQQFPALFIIILIHADKQPDPLLSRCPLQRVRDENPFQRLQQCPAQVVCPERIQVGKFRELDVTDNRPQVPGAKQQAR